MRIADFETHGGGKAIITDEDISVEAIVRLDAKGMIESIESSRKTIPERDRPVPGHFASRFSSYAEVGGYRLPMQIASEIILPEGEYVCAEYEITLLNSMPPARYAKGDMDDRSCGYPDPLPYHRTGAGA